MREYKFREKEIGTSKWVYGFYLEQDTYNMGSKNTKRDSLIKDAGVIVQNSKCHRGTIIDKKTLGQYTGLKDRNMKEIYEGDIIDDGGTIYKVLYYLDGFVAEVIKTKEDKEQISDVVYALADFDKGCRVIGNIYDNPELLEEEN